MQSHSSFAQLVCPYPEALQPVGAEGVADRDISRVATAGDQHPADARRVVPSVKGPPMTAKIYLEPGSEIHRAVWGRYANVAQVAGAVTCRNVHAAAECDGEVREITADAGPLIESLPGRLRGARMLVVKLDMPMDKVADRLDASPSSRRIAEKIPRRLG